MSRFDNNSENQTKNNYLTWLFVYMSIGLLLALFFPFPISVGVLLLVLFLVNIARTEIALRKAGIGGLYRSHSSLGLRRGIRNGLVYTPLKFYCMNCGQEHKKIACHKCGSKAVRTG